MIRLIINKKLYSYERLIFPKKKESSKCDVIRYMRFYEKPQDLKVRSWDNYRTPVTDLRKTEDEIRKDYSKDVRYEIRRAAKEGIVFKFYDKLDITSDGKMIDDVVDKYYAFCDQIQLPELKYNLNYYEFCEMVKNGNIIITKAEFENGWTYHVYQVDGERALLWFSFSDYRKENSNKSMAGWANRGLHDADIMAFKRHGYFTYDWGNIASEEEPNQIDKFKMSFGGEIKTAYCCFVGNSRKGKLLIKLREIKKRAE